jgi:hypothetical protein
MNFQFNQNISYQLGFEQFLPFEQVIWGELQALDFVNCAGTNWVKSS